MGFDKYGIDEVVGAEGLCSHIDYEGLKFNKSSFVKEWIDKYLDCEIKTIMDIGALDGGDSLRFSSWYPNANIFTIEGSPHNFEVLVKKLGNKKPNIKAFNYIMSDVDGILTFHQTTYGSGDDYMVMGSIYDIIESKKAKHNLKTIEPINVQSISFDKFCEINNITEVDFAHIDIEGATYNLVLGMNKVLPKMIFTEQEGNEFFKNKTIGGNDELIKLLISKGYKMVLKLSNDFLFILEK